MLPLTIALAVLRYMASNYPFGFFKFFFKYIGKVEGNSTGVVIQLNNRKYVYRSDGYNMTINVSIELLMPV